MKLTLKVEIPRPAWLAPTAHTIISSGGLLYLHSTGTATFTIAVAVAAGMSYGQLVSKHNRDVR